MTPTPLTPASVSASVSASTPAPAPDVPIRTFQRVLRAVALTACLPYLSLKIAWVSGSVIGIPEDSSLRDAGTTLVVANLVSVALDATLVVIVLLLTRPWGLRIRSWLIGGPVFVATGLLTPIVVGFPVQLAVRGLGGGQSAAREPFLDDWVFDVVYGGFIVQALALAGLFVPYATRRWGHLWRDGAGVPTARTDQVLAVAASLAALAVGAMYLAWACGATTGLGADRIAELDADTYALDAVYVALALVAVAGVLALAFRTTRLRTALALAWTGSAALGCWGAWMTLAALSPSDSPTGAAPALLRLTYAGQMLAGLLAAVVLTRFLTARRVS
ncbi:hypothetical protein [Streptomyces beijiangensis]|uniref:LigA protein n=1 Tax=Streptomyces beijiangensis TaxID=163361 RepID=A0A939FDS6_9ACTN|nr:hypothetical protein [Streptomyces beijiangensis]MBO0516158.1 hypothetical protein [Streptomyces beijiangensis]